MDINYSCFRHLAVRRELRDWLLAALLLVSHLAAAQCPSAASCQPGNAPANSLNLGFGILHVQLANLDTTTNGAGDGYQDYSCRRAARLDRGTTYTLQVTTGPNADERVRAWADFNQDGVFSSTTELIFSSVGRQHAGSFTVPTTLSPGASLRLRLAADYVDAPLPGPCTTPQYSQTEDYRVVITAASPPRPGAQFRAADSVTCSGTVQLRDRSRNAPTSWRWDFGDGTRSIQQHPTHVYSAAGTYTVKLRVCNASGCDSLTRAGFVTVRADGPKPAPCQPATAAYCCDFGLARVRLTGLDHRPGGGAASYQDASCSYRATLRADWPDTLRLTTGGAAAHDVRVYLDLNNDGQFTPPTELLYQGQSVINPTIPLRISSLTAGLVYNQALRLRVWTDYAGSPATGGACAAPQWGQVADYSVTVLPNTLVPQAGFRLAYVQACGPVQVNFQNTSVGSATYRWDFGDGTFSTAATPPTHTYTTPGAYVIKLVARGPALADSTTRQTAVATCQTYCTSGGWGGNEDSPLYFTGVQVADMHNTTYRAPRVGYRDFTSYVATVHQGEQVAWQTESLPFTSGGTGPWVITTGWIDYNQDGQFGPSEQLGTLTGYSPHQGTFRVPSRARVGATRMRLVVYLVIGGSGPLFSNGCLPSNFLCATEDYTVLVLPTATPPLTGFTAELTSSCSGQVQFRDTTAGAPTAWHWQFGDGSSSTLANPLHSYAAPGQYAVSLQATNAFGSVTVSRPAYVTVTATGQGPRPAVVPLVNTQLCCTYGIQQAQLATVAYQGGPNLLGYEDETCRLPALQLTAGSSYPLSVTRTSRFAYYQVYLWLDANNDGIFTAGEQIFSSATGYSGNDPKAGAFTVPATAVRNQPLRLRLYWHGLRYDNTTVVWPTPDPQVRDEEFDQVRDFTVWISGGALPTPLAQAVASWQVSPNPASDWLHLSQLTKPQTLEIRNVLGQVVRQATVQPDAGGECMVDVQQLPDGVYFLRLSMSGGVRSVLVVHGN